MSAISANAEPSIPLAPAVPAPQPIEPETPRGCGWFESSHELVHGVRVIEHAGFDALSFEVPLAWQLAAWC